MRRWRIAAHASAGPLLVTLCRALTEAYTRVHPDAPERDPPAAFLAARTEVEAAVHHPDWDTIDGAQLLMRLLCAAPFSAHDVRPPAAMQRRPRRAAAPDIAGPMPLCTAFGRLLDATVLPRHRMRPYANAWLAWAYRRVCELAGVYDCASVAVQHTPCVLCGTQAGEAGAAGRQALGALNDADDDLHPREAGPAPPNVERQ